MKKILLLALCALMLSCDCYFYEEDCGRCHKQYYSKRDGNDAFYADMLIGGWQCDYPMIINGMGELLGTQPNIRYEMKWMSFVNYSKCDITLQAVGDIDRQVYTFSYLYDGNTIRLSRNNRTIILTITGFLYPTLSLRDSYGAYKINKRS